MAKPSDETKAIAAIVLTDVAEKLRMEANPKWTDLATELDTIAIRLHRNVYRDRAQGAAVNTFIKVEITGGNG